MIKRVGLLKKRADLTAAEFARHWHEVHSRMAAQLPGVRKYLINIIDREQSPDSPIDGFSELWFEDTAAMQVAVATELFRQVKADEPNFTEEVRVVVVDERPIKG